MTVKYYLITALCFFLTAASAQDYKLVDKLLKGNVSESGIVDYKNLAAQKAELSAVYKNLTEADVTKFKDKDHELAYWINLYNIATLKLIIDKYPISSIQKLDGGKPWDVKRIKVGGKSYSLNDIENDKIRKFKDPRIHFAVNCAATSCPPLLNEAFLPEKINAQLDKQTKKFVNNKKANTLTADKASISKIFDWYKEDFGNVISFLNKYSTTTINAKAKVVYLEYDWSLNGK